MGFWWPRVGRRGWAAARIGLMALLRRITRAASPEPAGERLVAASVADAANDLFAAKFFQIVSGVARTVTRATVVGERTDASGDIGGGKAVG